MAVALIMVITLCFHCYIIMHFLVNRQEYLGIIGWFYENNGQKFWELIMGTFLGIICQGLLSSMGHSMPNQKKGMTLSVLTSEVLWLLLYTHSQYAIASKGLRWIPSLHVHNYIILWANCRPMTKFGLMSMKERLCIPVGPINPKMMKIIHTGIS